VFEGGRPGCVGQGRLLQREAGGRSCSTLRGENSGACSAKKHLGFRRLRAANTWAGLAGWPGWPDWPGWAWELLGALLPRPTPPLWPVGCAVVGKSYVWILLQELDYPAKPAPPGSTLLQTFLVSTTRPAST
jgi:hypothetical protein